MKHGESTKLVITFSGVQVQQLRFLAEKECLPMTVLAKQVVLKYLALQAPPPQPQP